MDEQQRRDELAQRLSNAGAAHGEYEMTALHGEYDEQWAEWYADFLLGHGWNDVLTRVWTPSELAAALRQANADHRANAAQQPWQDFYAERFAQA